MSRNTKKTNVTIDKAAVARAVAAEVLGTPKTMEETVRANVDELQAQLNQKILEAQQLQNLHAQAQTSIAALSGALQYAKGLLANKPAEKPVKAPAPTEAGPKTETAASTP